MTPSIRRKPARAFPLLTAGNPTADLFDPSGLGSLPAIPLVPEAVLREHNVFVATDNRFRAAARLLQALWRKDRDLPIGIHQNAKGDVVKLGSRISAKAGEDGGNFLHPAIAHLAQRELAYREIGAVYDDERLRTNLLSSQPLTFNLFGPLKLDLERASTVFEQLLPGFLTQITEIRFEHSPGRGHAAFTGDGTAFDVLIRGRTPTGQRAFVAIEVKYSETGFEPLPRFSGSFDHLAANSDLFVDPDDPELRSNPSQQLFRQTCLCQAMLETDLYDVGAHLFIAPRDNHLAQGMAAAYQRQLKNVQSGPMPFLAISLEEVITAIAAAGGRAHARALHRRYTDWWLVDGELSLADQMPLVDAEFTNSGSSARDDLEVPLQASQPSHKADRSARRQAGS